MNPTGRAHLHYAPVVLTIVLVAVGVYIAQVVYLSTASPYQELPIDSREAGILLAGAHAVERDQGNAFRWMSGATAITLYPRGRADATVLALSLGIAAPELAGTPLQLSEEGRVLARWQVGAQPRRYYILQPRGAPASSRITIELTGMSVTVPPDTRPVGTQIRAIVLRSLGGQARPLMSAVLIQTSIVLLGGGLLSMLVRRRWALLGIILIGCGLSVTFFTQPLLYTPYIIRLLLALAGLVLGTWIALPHFTRLVAWAGPPAFARAVWGLAVLACAVRLIGALYPLFQPYDLPLNLERLLRVTQGSLVAFNESFEFRGGVTVYPPGPYLLLLPALLSGIEPGPLVQLGMALIDGLSVISVALLGRQIGASAGASTIAGLLAAVMPISLTSLYYGHTAQIVGQALMAPLALLLIRALAQPQRRTYWVGAGGVLSAALLSHIGVSALAIGWMGLIWVALSLRRRADLGAWRYLTLMLTISTGIALLFVYGPVVGMHLAQLLRIGAEAAEARHLPAYNLIAKAYWIAYTPLGVLLFVPGLLLLARGMPREGRLVMWCWVAAGAAFAAIELLSGLQVRFLVFLAPLAALAAGAVLARAASYGRWGGLVVSAVLGLWAAQSTLAWYSGTFLNIAPSMVPLLR